MIATIRREFSFEASHQLPNHKGKCARLHGHSYVVIVEMEGAVKNKTGASDEGMVCDFAEIDFWWERACKPYLDHQHLNDTIGTMTVCVTTAENIAAWILRVMRDRLRHSGTVSSVTLYETARGSVTVT